NMRIPDILTRQSWFFLDPVISQPVEFLLLSFFLSIEERQKQEFLLLSFFLSIEEYRLPGSNSGKIKKSN
ncbi:hypothetical protein ACJX0J_011113, partial [Zea mays]